jgi:hypothetical protein
MTRDEAYELINEAQQDLDLCGASREYEGRSLSIVEQLKMLRGYVRTDRWHWSECDLEFIRGENKSDVPQWLETSTVSQLSVI